MLAVKVKPASNKNALIASETNISISLQARVQEGQANKMLIKYLAKFLRIQQKNIIIQSGTKSRHKLLKIEAGDMEQLRIIKLLTLT